MGNQWATRWLRNRKTFLWDSWRTPERTRVPSPRIGFRRLCRNLPSFLATNLGRLWVSGMRIAYYGTNHERITLTSSSVLFFTYSTQSVGMVVYTMNLCHSGIISSSVGWSRSDHSIMRAFPSSLERQSVTSFMLFVKYFQPHFRNLLFGNPKQGVRAKSRYREYRSVCGRIVWNDSADYVS